MVETMTFVCWSERQCARIHDSGYGVPLHIQGEDGGKTLCGIETDGWWGFIIHDYPPEKFDSCKRCKRAVAKTAINPGARASTY